MKICSIDLETTGLDPETCDIIEFAAVIDDLSKPRPIDTLPVFHSYVLPPNGKTYRGDPYALSMHSEIFRRIAKKEAPCRYLVPEEVIICFSYFLRDYGLTVAGAKATFAGKNFASFDLPFLKKIPTWYRVEHHHRILDPSILFLDINKDNYLPDTNTCAVRAGIPSETTHKALDDARQVIRLLRYGLLTKEPADLSSIRDEKPLVAGRPSGHVVVDLIDSKFCPVITRY